MVVITTALFETEFNQTNGKWIVCCSVGEGGKNHLPGHAVSLALN